MAAGARDRKDCDQDGQTESLPGQAEVAALWTGITYYLYNASTVSCCTGYPGHETDERSDKQGSHAGVQQVCPPVLVCIALNSCGREQSPACSPAPSPLPARRALDRVEGAARGLNLLQERLRQVGHTPASCACCTRCAPGGG